MGKSFKSWYADQSRDAAKVSKAIKQDDDERIEKNLKKSSEIDEEDIFPKEDIDIDEETLKKYLKK